MKTILDNPIWYALNTRDAENNIGSYNFAFFDADVAPFIGMASWDQKSQKELINNVDAGRNWSLLIGKKVQFIENLEVNKFSDDKDYNIFFSQSDKLQYFL